MPAIGSVGKGVLLLGMHRSGTSIATRMLALLGVGLPNGELIPPDEDNARGYWESRPLSAFNERLLEEFDGCWHAPPAVVPSAQQFQLLCDEARSLWGRAFNGQQMWVWKDPRLCLLLPFWNAVISPSPARLLVHRHPLEIADSLHRRNGLSMPHALALWERYIREALLGCDGEPVLVESYDRLLADPPGWLERVAAYLRSSGLAVDAGRCDLTSELLRPRAAPGNDVLLRHMMTPQQFALVELLRDLTGLPTTVDSSLVPPESPTTEALLGHARQSWSIHRQFAAADERYNSDVATLRAAIDVSRRESAALSQERAGLLQNLERVMQELEQAKQSLEAMRSSTSWRVTRPLRSVGVLRSRPHRGDA